MLKASEIVELIKEKGGKSKAFTYPGSPPRYIYKEAEKQGIDVQQVVREQHMPHMAQTRYFSKLEDGEEELPVVIASGEMGEAMMSQGLLAGSISSPCLVIVAEERFEHVDNALNIAHHTDRGKTPEKMSNEKQLFEHENIAGRILIEDSLESLEHLIDKIQSEKSVGIVHIPLYSLEDFDEQIEDQDAWKEKPKQMESEELGEKLVEADKPLIVAGKGAKHKEKRQRIADIADRIGAPIAVTMQMEGYFEDNYVGRIGTMGTPSANQAFVESDLVISFGTSMNNLITSYNSDNIQDFKDKTVQIEPNPGRVSNFVGSYMQDDEKALETIENTDIESDNWFDLQNYGSSQKFDYIPDNVLKLGQLMKDDWSDKAVTLGVGNHMVWMSYALGPDVKKEVSRVGSMGEFVSGINREENPVIVTGDGEFEMDLSVLLEAQYQDQHPNIFVINNTRLGMVTEPQEAEFGDIITPKQERPVEYSELEKVFPNMKSYSVEDENRLEEVFEEIVDNPETTFVVEIKVNKPFNPELYSTDTLPTLD
jgi:thiamine pyrophosphate-dependent acetolactate synthase large subunit-like protein